MDLPIGGRITLRFDDNHHKLEGVLIGSEPDQFLIVRLLQNADAHPIKEGQSYYATYISSGVIYRVQNSVLHYLEKLKLAILAYPVTRESDELRKESRISCAIPATANIEKNALKGLITDISNHGCQFIVKIPANFKLFRISVLTDIYLSLSVLGDIDPTRLKGKVRNTNADEFKIALGIEFEKMEEQISHRLLHFIENLKEVQ